MCSFAVCGSAGGGHAGEVPPAIRLRNIGDFICLPAGNQVSAQSGNAPVNGRCKTQTLLGLTAAKAHVTPDAFISSLNLRVAGSLRSRAEVRMSSTDQSMNFPSQDLVWRSTLRPA